MRLTCNSQTCLLLGKPSPIGGKSWGGRPHAHFWVFQEPGLQGTRLLVPSSLNHPLYSLHPHSLCFFLCFFFFFFFFAALLSFDVRRALLPASLSESELLESDDFLSLCFFFFFSWKENLKTQHYMCILALKNHDM